MNTDTTFYRSIAKLVVATGFLLLIPLIAMQFTKEVVWTISDFIFAGGLLFGSGFLYILVTRIFAPGIANNIIYRIAVGFALFTGLLLIWVNAAVGIIGSENNEINLLYFGVIAVGIIGALIARFKTGGMMLTLIAMVATQAVIAGVALFSGMAKVPGSSLYEILAVNGFFITLFIVAALLFRYAKDKEVSAEAEKE